ncbi:cupin domain-containing protein [Ensifer sp. MJa1]|uniref:cupin domain-containing protein n=1 Tax=Ensifer sp. MJa1 TaxID=2919888 RepID=UPI00300B1C74
MKKLLVVAAPFSAMLLLSSAALAGESSSVNGVISAPAADLKWVELPRSGGVKYANVRGDLTGKGPYEAFVLFPAGANNPYHNHSAAIPTVVIQGTFYAVVEGKRTEYPAGSFYDLPGKMNHYSGCLPGMDCLLFQYQKDHFDLVPQTEK